MSLWRLLKYSLYCSNFQALHIWALFKPTPVVCYQPLQFLLFFIYVRKIIRVFTLLKALKLFWGVRIFLLYVIFIVCCFQAVLSTLYYAVKNPWSDILWAAYAVNEAQKSAGMVLQENKYLQLLVWIVVFTLNFPPGLDLTLFMVSLAIFLCICHCG